MTPEERDLIAKVHDKVYEQRKKEYGVYPGMINDNWIETASEYASLISKEKDSEISLLKNQIANLELRLGERTE